MENDWVSAARGAINRTEEDTNVVALEIRAQVGQLRTEIIEALKNMKSDCTCSGQHARALGIEAAVARKASLMNTSHGAGIPPRPEWLISEAEVYAQYVLTGTKPGEA